jgi:hypothetical protein
VFVETADRRVLDRGLEQRVQHVEAGLVGGEPGTLDFHAAEGAHVHVAVFAATPRAAPVLHLHHRGVRVGYEVLDDILLAEPVTSRDRVVEMVFEAIVRLGHCRRAALCGYGVAAHRVDLGDQGNGEPGIVLGHRDRSA